MHADDNHTHNEAQQINTNNGEVELSIHEENHVARFRFKQITGHADFAENISAIVDRGNGEQEIYRFTHKKDGLSQKVKFQNHMNFQSY